MPGRPPATHKIIKVQITITNSGHMNFIIMNTLFSLKFVFLIMQILIIEFNKCVSVNVNQMQVTG